MYLTRHQTFRGPCWAVDGYWLPDGFHLDLMLQRSLVEIRDALANARSAEPADGALLAPIEDTQEVWAAGTDPIGCTGKESRTRRDLTCPAWSVPSQ